MELKPHSSSLAQSISGVLRWMSLAYVPVDRWWWCRVRGRRRKGIGYCDSGNQCRGRRGEFLGYQFCLSRLLFMLKRYQELSTAPLSFTLRLPDSWVSESDRPQMKTKVVHLSQLPQDTAVLLDPNIYRWGAHLSQFHPEHLVCVKSAPWEQSSSRRKSDR